MIVIYLLTLVLAFLGLYAGLIVSYFCKEELKPGMDYLNWLMHIIFIAILAIFFVKNPSWLFIILVSAIIIFFSLSKNRETLYYYALAIIFFLSWRYNGFAMIAPLIFLYGFPLGSMHLYYNIKEKKKQVIMKLFYRYVGFLINGIILGLIGLLL
jgi:hypothetical protein